MYKINIYFSYFLPITKSNPDGLVIELNVKSRKKIILEDYIRE